MCFDKEKRRDMKMRLIYNLFKAKTAYVCLQQQLKMRDTAVKLNVINIVKKSFKFKNEMNEKEIYDENMLIKIRAVR